MLFWAWKIPNLIVAVSNLPKGEKLVHWCISWGEIDFLLLHSIFFLISCSESMCLLWWNGFFNSGGQRLVIGLPVSVICDEGRCIQNCHGPWIVPYYNLHSCSNSSDNDSSVQIPETIFIRAAVDRTTQSFKSCCHHHR